MTATDPLAAIPSATATALRSFVDSAVSVFSDDLVSVTLFGSAAEGRLRMTSDVNVIVVLERLRREALDGMAEPVRLAEGLIRLSPMFVLRDEIDAAAAEFALKFSDITNRHVVLHGEDVFAAVTIDREQLVRRVRQVLLNLSIRLRERYVTQSLRQEQAARVIAEMAGPLRAAAAAIVELETGERLAPRAALQRLADGASDETATLLDSISDAREKGMLPPGEAPARLFAMLQLAESLYDRSRRLG
jgi:predicted nucleotidyltransferase